MQEMWVPSLVQEDPLEKEMASTPVFLPRESHAWTEESDVLQFTGSQRVRPDLATEQQQQVNQ